MSTFSKTTFSASGYAASRPTYPPALFSLVLSYHSPRPRKLLVDLGCGTGQSTLPLAPHFTAVIGTDPSSNMVKRAIEKAAKEGVTNVKYRQARAEELPFIESGSVDMVVAAQAAHWFNHEVWFEEMHRVLKPKGTLAFWGYKDPVFPKYPVASKTLDNFAYGDNLMGPMWEPGRAIVRNKLRDLEVPRSMFKDEQRIEYEPGSKDPQERKAENRMIVRRWSLQQLDDYVRTWSPVYRWAERHPEEKSRTDGGRGDVVDRLMDEFKAMGEKDAGGLATGGEIDVEWGSAIVLARKRED